MNKYYSLMIIVSILLLLNNFHCNHDDEKTDNLEGTWVSNCIQDSFTSNFFKSTDTFTSGTIERSSTIHTESTCSNAVFTSSWEGTYSIGSTVETSDTLEKVKELDIHFPRIPALAENVYTYTIYMIKNSQLYIGECIGENDCSSEDKRASSINENIFYIKQ